ncbi:MAG TPA: hypothetical protein VL137_00590 [Polyangiaceae bacterium]|nr:hypothetical protein [Polyangiaceae bacterium]
MSRLALDAVASEMDLYPEIRRGPGPIDAVEALRKHIEFRAPGGDTFSIAFTGVSPIQAQQVTARLAAIVIAQDSDLRQKRALLTRDFLEIEERTTGAKLRDSEQELAVFMGGHPSFAFDATPLVNGAAVRASLEASKAKAAQTGTTTTRWRVVKSKQDAVVSAAIVPLAAVTAESLQAAAEQARAEAALTAARVNLSNFTARFTPAHPDVQMAAAEVERATKRLATARVVATTLQGTASVPRVGESLSAVPQPTIASRRLSVAPAVPVAGLGSVPDPEAANVVVLETQWITLTRAVTEAREHQDQVEAALFKANSAVSVESGGRGVQVAVIDPAFLPQTSMPPGRTTVTAIFMVVALVLGLLSAALWGALDDRVYRGRDIPKSLELLSEIPRAFSK